jgi:hypothetical protein
MVSERREPINFVTPRNRCSWLRFLERFPCLGFQFLDAFHGRQLLRLRAAELLEELNGNFHRLRQSGFDAELFDVISGFEALAGPRQHAQRVAIHSAWNRPQPSTLCALTFRNARLSQ